MRDSFLRSKRQTARSRRLKPAATTFHLALVAAPFRVRIEVRRHYTAVDDEEKGKKFRKRQWDADKI
jgi:hypothetical protein